MKSEQEQQARLANSVLFSDWVKHWLHDVAAKRVDTITLEGYERTATSQVIPYFKEAGLSLEEITLQALQQMPPMPYGEIASWESAKA